jgi:hypothetical protein
MWEEVLVAERSLRWSEWMFILCAIYGNAPTTTDDAVPISALLCTISPLED